MTSPSEKHQALFSALVSSYTTQAMVCLGKMGNPQTGEIERDLHQASMLIDMLEMLEARTEGNVTDEERSALRQALSMLRLNYVEERNKPESDAATSAERDDSEDASGDDADRPQPGAPGV